MSDILIKNMKMPDKATTIVVFPEGKVRVFRQDIDHDEWLTAIEVPPHGRLIDADEMLQFLVETFGEEVKAGFAWKTISEHCITIIEAEGT